MSEPIILTDEDIGVIEANVSGWRTHEDFDGFYLSVDDDDVTNLIATIRHLQAQLEAVRPLVEAAIAYHEAKRIPRSELDNPGTQVDIKHVVFVEREWEGLQALQKAALEVARQDRLGASSEGQD